MKEPRKTGKLLHCFKCILILYPQVVAGLAFLSPPTTLHRKVDSTRLRAADAAVLGKPITSISPPSITTSLPPSTSKSGESRKAPIRRDILVEPEFVQNLRSNMTQTKMALMSAAGTVLTAGIIYTLASSGGAAEPASLITNAPLLELATLEEVTETVIDAAVPLTATDAVSVAFAEVFAGAFSALVGFSLAISMRLRRGSQQGAPSVSDAVADGDFLVAQAAALPILRLLGVPNLLAIVGTVAFASIPAELSKFQSRKRQQRMEEDLLMDELLRKQKEQERFRIRPLKFLGLEEAEIVDLETLKPVQKKEPGLDVTEVFCDIMKWLEYDVLTSNLDGKILWNGSPLIPGVEDAFYGSLAALSAQVYGDILYSNFGFGSEKKREIIRSRSLADWAFVYISRAAYGFILFGVYEAAQIPANSLVTTLLSGGAEGCAGSIDFDLCVETYMADNPPEASLLGQGRALITGILGLINQFGLPDLPVN